MTDHPYAAIYTATNPEFGVECKTPKGIEYAAVRADRKCDWEYRYCLIKAESVKVQLSLESGSDMCF